VPHDDAIVHADRVELERHAAGLADGVFHHASELLQVHVAGHDVDVRVAHGHERLVEVVRRANLSRGSQKASMRCALEAALDRIRAHDQLP